MASEGNPTTSQEQANDVLGQAAPAKEKKSAEQLAAMIREELSYIEGWPQRGITVSVYGFDSWNAMLTFGVEAGPLHNKRGWQGFCEVIAKDLKRLYDIC